MGMTVHLERHTSNDFEKPSGISYPCRKQHHFRHAPAWASIPSGTLSSHRQPSPRAIGRAAPFSDSSKDISSFHLYLINISFTAFCKECVCVSGERYVQPRSLVFRLVSWWLFQTPSVILRAMVKPEELREKPWFLTLGFHTQPGALCLPALYLPAALQWGPEAQQPHPLPQFEF